MTPPPLVIVTATTDLERARPCLESWIRTAAEPPPIFLILNGVPARPQTVVVGGTQVAWIYSPEYLGTVPAFRLGVDCALKGPYPIIACLHDDVEIQETGWDQKVLKYFDRRPEIGLAGFGGASGLGALDMYLREYDPMSLARVGFRSDLVDAEAHGIRSLLAERVACLDGFSQIGRREFWEGAWGPGKPHQTMELIKPTDRPWQVLEDLDFKHHFYDGALGCLAARQGWETWYVPVRAQHYGGRTAVGDPGYQAWAQKQDPKGDQGFWEAAHKIGWDNFKDVLPLRV